MGGASSGVQFCAYHGTIAPSGSVPEVYYGVLPDFTTGGMTVGCGASTTFGNETSVSSHELVEATTDPEVGLATVFAPPLAWYDAVNGEIGDICNAQQGSIVGGDGVTYVVQQEFSNVANDCIVSRPVTSDFSVSAAPTSLTVAQGASGTSTISTTAINAPESVSLAATGLPSGVTASFSPASVNAGGSSTLTLTASSGATTGPATVTVTGTAASGGPHSATVSLTITTPPPSALTVTADAKSKAYGAANPALTATLSGFVLGQTLATSGVSGVASCSTTAVASSVVGSYPITCVVGSLASGNYSFGPFVAGTLTVTKAPLTVTADAKSKVAGSANPALTATLSGFVLGQTLATSGVSGAASCSTTATAASAVGTYPITCVVGSLASGNYSFGPFVGGR